MAFDGFAIMAGLTSKGQQLGLFDRVNGHEAINAPGQGLNLEIWADSITPSKRRSGLNSTTLVVTTMARISKSVNAQPGDRLEPEVMNATVALMAAFLADLGLKDPQSGVSVMEFDPRGQEGTLMAARAGFVSYDGSAMYRCMVITIAGIVDDVLPEIRQ